MNPQPTTQNWPQSLATGSLLALLTLGLAACGKTDPAEPQSQAPAGAPDLPGDPPADDSKPSVIGKFSGADLSSLSNGSGDLRAMAGFPSSPNEQRSFRRLTEDDKAEVAALVASFRATTDAKEQMEILAELETFYGEEILDIVAEALQSPDEELRAYAVEILAGNISERILETLAPALEDESQFVRIAALEAVIQVQNPAVADFVGRAFADDEVSVRHAALIAADEMVDQNRYSVLEKALTAPHADIAVLAIGDLEVAANRQALEALFRAIDSPNPEVREEARFSVSWLIDENFETTAAAQAWWAEHRREFDNELARQSE